MRTVNPFDPMAPGEIDRFALDFSTDTDPDAIDGATWSVTLLPGLGSDPSPQSRVLGVSLERAIDLRSSLDGRLHPRRGAYVTALVGGLPATAMGGTYLHEATARLHDGRVLKRSSTMLCG